MIKFPSLIVGGILASGAVAVGLTNPSIICHSVNGLPDHSCTPGSINQLVTQSNIKTTICVTGYTVKIRPVSSYTESLKAKQMKQYGLRGSLANFEEDHLIPLELGGNPVDSRNLWPESWNGTEGAHAKDKVENKLHTEVCSGKLTLQQAQQEIATDWEVVK